MRSSHKFSLLYFGSDTFSVRILKHLLNKKICPIKVVTRTGTLLDEYSAKQKLQRHRWPLTVASNGYEENFNIGLVASFGHMIDSNTVNKFQHGLFNVHPSLLPQYRGSTPVQAAIRDGLDETGCTIMRIPPVEKFDIGEVILQERMTINYREYAVDLRDRLADKGAKMAEELLSNYDNCMRNSKLQSELGKSYAKKLKPEDGLLRFKDENSIVIDRKVRAYTGFIDLYTLSCGGIRIKLNHLREPKEVEEYRVDQLVRNLWRSKNINANHVEPGTIFFHKTRHTLCIKCFDNEWLAFDSITPECKPQMSSLDYYNGYLSKIRIDKRRTDV